MTRVSYNEQGIAREEVTNVSVSDILSGLARQSNLPSLTLDGKPLNPDLISAVLMQSATLVDRPVRKKRAISLSLITWLLFSVAFTLFLAVLIDALSLMRLDLSLSGLFSELLLRGDLALIGAGFAAEALGDILRSQTLEPSQRVTIAFCCALLLVVSILVCAECQYVSVFPELDLIGQLRDRLPKNLDWRRHYIPPTSGIVFLFTMAAVFSAKYATRGDE